MAGEAPTIKGGLKGDIGGIPKPIAIGGVIFAVLLGLYLRSKNKASAGTTPVNDSSNTPSTGSGGYVTDNSSYIPPIDQSSNYSSPYDPYSALIASGFSSTEAVNALNDLANGSLDGLSSTPSTTDGSTTSAPAPGGVTINLGASTAAKSTTKKKTVAGSQKVTTPKTPTHKTNHRTPGRPKKSARPKSTHPTRGGNY